MLRWFAPLILQTFRRTTRNEQRFPRYRDILTDRDWEPGYPCLSSTELDRRNYNIEKIWYNAAQKEFTMQNKTCREPWDVFPKNLVVWFDANIFHVARPIIFFRTSKGSDIHCSELICETETILFFPEYSSKMVSDLSRYHSHRTVFQLLNPHLLLRTMLCD